MFNRTWLSALLLVSVALFACGQQDQPVAPAGYEIGDEIYTGGRSKEEMILASSVIVRANLTGMSTSTVQTTAEPGSSYWTPVLKFRFRVLKYLKGAGPTEIDALVTDGGYHDTQATARAQLPRMEAAHDTQWDDRQAILFLDNEWANIPSLSSSLFVLGDISPDGELSYTIGTRHAKVWLPAAQTLARGSDPLFLLDAPGSTRAATRSTTSTHTSTAPTISLSAFKQLTKKLLAEASSGGTDRWRACVEDAYQFEREQQYRTEKYGTFAYQHQLDAIRSGQPAGVVVWTASGLAFDENRIGRHWFSGPDAAAFGFSATDFQTRGTSTEEFVLHTRNLVTARPLPAGEYRFGYNAVPPWIAMCGKFTDKPVELREMFLSITSGPRILHEAFFDPVAIATAVGADSSNGVLKPNAFSLNGTNTTISSLKWEEGAVTMTLSPTASLADYAIDFIDVNGTTTLSLTSDNASTTPLAWTVPDKPWADGDLLMLRIHRPISTDATLSGLALSGVDLTFSTATTTYTASVPATTTQTTVTPTTNHDSATYVVKLGGVVDDDGTIPLAAGANVITIDVTAEDAVTTRTYTVTITRATPSAPVTVTLTPRTEGLTFFDLTIEWNDPQTCDNRYFVTVRRNDGYIVRNMGFHPAETTSATLVTYWPMDNVPDFVAVVECDPSSGPRREVGRMSLRSAQN